LNEQWKRLIEAERRVARLESSLSRTNQNVVAVQGQIQNSSQNITNPFGSGGGGGGAGLHRFAIEYNVWVEWDTVPTLKTGASLNPTADVTSLAEAVSRLEEGVTFTNASVGAFGSSVISWGYDIASGEMFQLIGYGEIVDPPYTALWSIVKFDGGNFVIDKTATWDQDFSDECTLSESSRFRLICEWNRRNGVGAIIGTPDLTARRTSGSEDTFSYGPTLGDSGTWSFEMECPETTYNNAGSGTIYLRWGEPLESIYSGGSPDDLPADAFDGGSPDDLPTDIIDGGLI